MNRISHSVFWREKGDAKGDGDFFKAPLEFDANGQPFVILHNWLKNGKPLFDQKIPLNPAFLNKMPSDSSSYLYKGEIKIPDDLSN
jgi:hypothetical protein